jgi:septal ring factor EnvC (AmiA/AmiB activator)
MKIPNPHPTSIRVSFLAVIVACLVVMGVNLSQVKQKITHLQSHLVVKSSALQKSEGDLARTLASLAETAATLKTTKAALDTTAAEKQQALANLADQTKRAQQLSVDLAKSHKVLDTKQAELARYHAAGMQPEEIMTAGRRIKDLSAALAAARQTNNTLVARLKQLAIVDEGPILLQAKLQAKVVASDPKWHFIVLNAGEKQGVLANAELLVSRQGKFLARARVTRVQDDRCIADLMPGWQLVQVLEGDVVIPAFPHS